MVVLSALLPSSLQELLKNTISIKTNNRATGQTGLL